MAHGPLPDQRLCLSELQITDHVVNDCGVGWGDDGGGRDEDEEKKKKTSTSQQ